MGTQCSSFLFFLRILYKNVAGQKSSLIGTFDGVTDSSGAYLVAEVSGDVPEEGHWEDTFSVVCSWDVPAVRRRTKSQFLYLPSLEKIWKCTLWIKWVFFSMQFASPLISVKCARHVLLSSLCINLDCSARLFANGLLRRLRWGACCHLWQPEPAHGGLHGEWRLLKIPSNLHMCAVTHVHIHTELINKT